MGIRLGTLEGLSLRGIGAESSDTGQWQLKVRITPMVGVWRWNHPGWSKHGLEMQGNGFTPPPPPSGDVYINPEKSNTVPVTPPVLTNDQNAPAASLIPGIDNTTLLIVAGVIIFIIYLIKK